METEEDWNLVALAQAGDMDAFGELYKRHAHTVFSVLFSRTRDWQLSEDFTGETFLRALRRIHTVTNQGRQFPAWLVTIAINIHLDYVRSSYYRLSRSWHGIPTTESYEDAIPLNVPMQRGPEDTVTDRATLVELRRCVSELSPKYRRCIELRYLQGMSHAEVAAEMDSNEPASRMLQHHAIRRLAKMMEAAA